MGQLNLPSSIMNTAPEPLTISGISPSDIERAKDWSADTLRTIIYPKDCFDDVKRDWDKFLMMPVDDQRESDEICMLIFGMTNQDMYDMICHVQYQNPNYKPGNVDIVGPDSRIKIECADIKSTMSNVISLGASKGAYTNYSIQNLIESGYFYPAMPDIDKLIKEDICFTPSQMYNLGVFGNNNKYGEAYTNKLNEKYKVKDWFEAYVYTFSGVRSSILDEVANDRVELLKELALNIENGSQPDKCKQTMLELGWDPNIPFNHETRVGAYAHMRQTLEESVQDIEEVNLESFVDSADDTVVSEDANSSLKPVFVVFLKSDSVFNRVVSKVTKGAYGHVSIGFHPDLTSLYSFNVMDGGFSRESIKKYKDVVYMSVMCFFVPDTSLKKMRSKILNFNKHKDETSYGFGNLINCLTKKASESNLSMVCSGFVDMMMKTAGASATKVSYSVVNPNSLRRSMGQKRRFYKIFKGPIHKYNPNKVKNHINSLLTSFTNESKIDYTFENDTEDLFKKMVAPYIGVEPIAEQDFFIQFNKQGDLLIGKRNIDFEAEYAKSHRLLLEYDEANNYDGIKYELAKLWYMNSLLQDKIYNGKGNKNAHLRARAKILNDFKKYLKVVLKEDKKFNFNKYYKNTPYNDDKTRIKSSTIDFGVATLKKIVL